MRKQYKEILRYSFEALIVITFFATLVLLFTYPIPEENKDVVLVGAGALFTAFATVVNFELGSTSGSQRKTEIIAQSTAITPTTDENIS